MILLFMKIGDEMKRFFLVCFILFFLIVLYSLYVEPKTFTINSYSIYASLPDSYKNLKIVHFSDNLINSEYSIETLSDVVTEINTIDPDIVLFTGDLLDSSYKISPDHTEEVINILSNIECKLFKFAIYGDNDYKIKSTYSNIMEESDFVLLDNETFLFYYKDSTPISITGITNLDALEEAYFFEEDVFPYLNITLTHKPDDFDNLPAADIVFAGHSLGGYVNIPYIGSLINRNGANKYTEDYHKIGDKYLFVSNVIGLENYKFRLNNVPSINVYNFV